MAERFSCARTSAVLGEPMLGTASQVRRWVLLEQPGSWGHDALLESRLSPSVGEELRRRCRSVGARPLTIRRSPSTLDGPRAVFVASSAPEGPWLERLELEDAEQVLDLDLAPLADDASVGGQRWERSLLLTCTNGSHDACCAEYGRGVAATLDDALDERAWECSHIGGDRFAANVLCLPEGIYYGRVTPEAALGIARLHDQGRLSLPHYRGRSVAPFDAQAAETELRQHLGVDRIDAVRVRGRRPVEGGVVVDLEVDGRGWRIELEVDPDPVEQWLTCRATGAGHPPRFVVRELVELPGGAEGATTQARSR